MAVRSFTDASAPSDDSRRHHHHREGEGEGRMTAEQKIGFHEGGACGL
jgi:hypothetical protein